MRSPFAVSNGGLDVHSEVVFIAFFIGSINVSHGFSRNDRRIHVHGDISSSSRPSYFAVKSQGILLTNLELVPPNARVVVSVKGGVPPNTIAASVG